MSRAYVTFAAMVLLGYSLGSIPFGVLAARVARLDDIRKHGSGNIGATNVYRILGLKYAIPVLILDAAKGAVPAAIALRFSGFGLTGALAAGAAAILGHNWPVFLRFNGGKGVATTAGVALVTCPTLLVLGVGLFILTVAVTRYVSLGSLVGCWGAFLVSLTPSFGAVERFETLLLALLVTYRHRSNIKRLLSGTELKITWPGGRKWS